MSVYELGDTYGPEEGEDKCWTAGIHLLDEMEAGSNGWHYNAIECYGQTQADAEKRRERILQSVAKKDRKLVAVPREMVERIIAQLESDANEVEQEWGNGRSLEQLRKDDDCPILKLADEVRSVLDGHVRIFADDNARPPILPTNRRLNLPKRGLK